MDGAQTVPLQAGDLQPYGVRADVNRGKRRHGELHSVHAEEKPVIEFMTGIVQLNVQPFPPEVTLTAAAFQAEERISACGIQP
jgi:hypothetical protein